MKLIILITSIALTSCASIKSKCHNPEGSYGNIVPTEKVRLQVETVLPKPLLSEESLCWYWLGENIIKIRSNSYGVTVANYGGKKWELLEEWIILQHKRK